LKTPKSFHAIPDIALVSDKGVELLVNIAEIVVFIVEVKYVLSSWTVYEHLDTMID